MEQPYPHATCAPSAILASMALREAIMATDRLALSDVGDAAALLLEEEILRTPLSGPHGDQTREVAAKVLVALARLEGHVDGLPPGSREHSLLEPVIDALWSIARIAPERALAT